MEEQRIRKIVREEIAAQMERLLRNVYESEKDEIDPNSIYGADQWRKIESPVTTISAE